jgi:hypothetical protein
MMSADTDAGKGRGRRRKRRNVTAITDARRGVTGVTHARQAVTGVTRNGPGAPEAEQPERVFIIIECRRLDGGWAGDLTAGGLGAWLKLLSYVRIFYWNCGGAPLADLTEEWRRRRGISGADWSEMLKLAQKAGELAIADGRLVILNPDWLRSPRTREQEGNAERQRRHRQRQKKGGGRAKGREKGVTLRGVTGVTPGVTGRDSGPQDQLKDQLDLKDQSEEEGTGGKNSQTKKKEDPAQDTAVPQPDTAGGASSGPPAAPARAPTATGWEGILELTLINLAFGRRPSPAQKLRLQEACEEACARGATRGMIYRRLRRPRPAAQNVFDCVRQAGLDARGALTAFREFLKVDTLGWAEVEQTAFDTTAQAGIQRQAEWNALKDTWGLVLVDVQPLVPEDAAAMKA